MSKKCDLSIVLEQPQRTFAVGDTVAGFVGVEVNSTATCKALTLTLRWRTHGRGNRTSGDVRELTLFEGEWTEGETHLHPFELTVPDGPLTYHGHFLNIVWELHARADVPWALDPKVSEELVVVQSTPRRDLTTGPSWSADVPAVAAVFKSVILGVMGLLITSVGCVGTLGLSADLGGVGVFALVPLLFSLGGLFLLWLAVRQPLAGWRLGKVQLGVPDGVLAGESLAVEVSLCPRQRAHLNGITARLKGQEIVVAGSGTKKRTYRHQLHLDECALSAAQRVERGQQVRVTGTFAVPPDAAPSFSASNNEVRWEVEVELDIARWPDWKRSARLAVRQ